MSESERQSTIDITIPVRSVFRFPESLPSGVDALAGNDVFRDADFEFECKIYGSYFFRYAKLVSFKPTDNSVLRVEAY